MAGGARREKERGRASEFCRVKSQNNERCSLHATPLSTRTTPSTSAAAPLTPLYPLYTPNPFSVPAPPATSATLASFAAISCCDVVHFSRHTFCCLRCCCCCNPRLVGVAAGKGCSNSSSSRGRRLCSTEN